MSPLRRSSPLRWWLAGAGVLLGLLDTAGMTVLGVGFEMNGKDVTWIVAGFFASSFALLGFLLGHAIEARRRDRKATALIRSQMEALGHARARLAESEKLAALGQLAAAVAHEVRNPLAVIRSAAQDLAESSIGEDAEARRAASFISAEIDRLTNVVNSLLSFARPPQIQRRSVAVRELLDRALLLAAEELAGRGVKIRRREAGDSLAIAVDEDLLCQVLLGLLANAAEATPPGGEVTVEARRLDAHVELAVADSGPGVPPELRARIFEPFFTTRSRGTGLGLAVARQIVEAHGGRIEVGDRAGGGARFSVQLPAGRGLA